MKRTRVRAFMPKNFRRPEKLAAFIKMEQCYGQPVREPLRNGKRSGQKTVVLQNGEESGNKVRKPDGFSSRQIHREPHRTFKTRWTVNNGEHLAETPQITGGNSTGRMGERHRMISAYDNAVRTGQQPLMTKSGIFAR